MSTPRRRTRTQHHCSSRSAVVWTHDYGHGLFHVCVARLEIRAFALSARTYFASGSEIVNGSDSFILVWPTARSTTLDGKVGASVWAGTRHLVRTIESKYVGPIPAIAFLFSAFSTFFRFIFFFFTVHVQYEQVLSGRQTEQVVMVGHHVYFL